MLGATAGDDSTVGRTVGMLQARARRTTAQPARNARGIVTPLDRWRAGLVVSSNQNEENGRTGTGDRTLWPCRRFIRSLYNLVGRAVPRALSSVLLTVVGTPEYKAWA